MKIIFWRAFYKKIGLWNLIGLILSLLMSIIGMILVFKEFGLRLVFESFALSYLFDKIKDFKNAFKETKAEYEIETK